MEVNKSTVGQAWKDVEKEVEQIASDLTNV
jgi:hypothetical protein